MKTGEVYVVTTEEYSDFGIFAMVEALQDFDWDAVSREITETLEEPQFHQVLDVMLQRGLIRHAPRVRQLHWGDYNRIDFDAEKELSK